MHYLVLIAWGLCIFCAFLGYGRAVLRLLGADALPWPVAGTTGVALVLFIGSVLNLASALLPPILIAVILLGDVFLLSSFFRRGRLRQQLAPASEFRKPVNLALLIAFALLLAIPVQSSFHAHPYSFAFDDWGGYLTLPTQTFQLGALPSDPFNERRVTSALGASYVLQTFMFLVGGVRALRFIDFGVGFVLYAGALFALCRALSLPVRTSLALLFLIFIAPLSRPNLTMYVLPAALFLALLLIEIHPALGDRYSWRRSLLLGLTAAAAACLKSNYLPAAVLMCGIYYLVLFLSERRSAVLVQAALCGAVMLLALLPWMIDMKVKEGTSLFPVLGRGYDASAYGIPLPGGPKIFLAPGWISIWLALIPTVGPLLLGVFYIFFARRQRPVPHWPALLSFFLAAVVAVFLIASSTGGVSIGRYTAPFQLPALFVLIAAILKRRSEAQQRSPWLNGLAAVAALAIVFDAALFGIRDHEYPHLAREAGILEFVPPLHLPLDIEQEQRRIAALQAVIPPHEAILAHMFVTFPFDFKRNTIYSADFMGMASLPPGMPIGKGPDALRRYLLCQHIRYIAYDSQRTVPSITVPADNISTILAHPSSYGRLGLPTIQTKVSQDEEANISALAPRYRHIYDDGQVYVLDLLTPRT